jgi:DNA-binding CsgD family transcriptional regulator
MKPYTLTPAQQRVAESLLAGNTNGEIAKDLGIGLTTVKAHLNRMFLIFAIFNGHKRLRLAMALISGGKSEHHRLLRRRAV